MNVPEKAVVLLSGGIDSSTLLTFVKEAGFEPLALAVDYGQRHAKEIGAARLIAASMGCGLTTVAFPGFGEALSSTVLTDTTAVIPHGHYEDASMRATVVPNRNMILLSLAAAVAIDRGAGAVAFAAHGGDHAIYPDCRPEFVWAMERALAVSSYTPLRLLAPFVSWKKSEIVAWGAARGVPFDLTWSCYEGGVRHCGRCGTCVERREAFLLAGIEDPTAYEG